MRALSGLSHWVAPLTWVPCNSATNTTATPTFRDRSTSSLLIRALGALVRIRKVSNSCLNLFLSNDSQRILCASSSPILSHAAIAPGEALKAFDLWKEAFGLSHNSRQTLGPVTPKKASACETRSALSDVGRRHPLAVRSFIGSSSSQLTKPLSVCLSRFLANACWYFVSNEFQKEAGIRRTFSNWRAVSGVIAVFPFTISLIVFSGLPVRVANSA